MLWAVLAGLAVARALCAAWDTTWAWGLNILKFVPAPLGWALWSAGAIVLVPAAGHRSSLIGRRLGDLAAQAPWRAGALWALVAAALVAFIPDRLHFLGDFQMRSGSVVESIPLDLVYPQALELDLLVHVHLMRELAQRVGLDPNLAARLLGALDAALLGLAAMALPRALELRGLCAFAASSAALFGGTLCMFTGFGKATAEMCVASGAVAVLGVGVARQGRSPLPLGLVSAVALALHRSGVALLPAVLVADVLWLRAHAGGGRWRKPDALVGLSLPLAALALIGPRVFGLFTGFDRAHHLAPAGGGGALTAAFAPLHLADVGNTVVLLAPIVPAAAALPFFLGPRILRRAEGAVLLALALPAIALMLFVHPQQGVFRDLDVFAPSATALSFVAAWLVGETLTAAPRFGWLAAAIALGALTPTLTWLALNHDPERGIERVRSFVLEPPQRSGEVRARTWDYLGFRAMDQERWDQAADAWAHAAETAPSPKILTQWGMAEQMVGDLKQARSLYRRALALDPNSGLAWRGLATVSYRLGDYAESRRAAEEIRRSGIRAPELGDLIQALDSTRTVPEAPR